MVDTVNKRLISLASHEAIKIHESPAQGAIAAIMAKPNSPFNKLLDAFPGILKPRFHLEKMPHGIELAMNTQGPPLYCRPRRLAPDQNSTLEKELRAMLDAGIVRRSKSAWASPLHAVRESDGG